MAPLRLGAVSYLNARPLVDGLDRWPERFAVRYDLPSTCATLLHRGEIDLGLIPSIEYLRGEGYAIVPDCAIASDGPVRSVAIFTSVPIERVRAIALDTSSRTSVALTRVMAARHFGIAPVFVDHRPDLESMLGRADAALLIGDPALFADYHRLGLQKIDLGSEWKTFTGLPFVYACWTGRPGAVDANAIDALQAARALGETDADGVAARFFPGDAARAAEGARYLRENIRFRLGDRERAGLERFFSLAVDVGVVDGMQPLRWLGSDAVKA
jgi:chorismate dehydratase